MNQQRASLHPTWGEAGTTWVDRGTILWGVVCWVRINDQTFTAKLLGQLCLEGGFHTTVWYKYDKNMEREETVRVQVHCKTHFTRIQSYN